MQISMYKVATMDDIENKELYFKEFKKYVASTARGKRVKRILSKPLYSIQPCGILKRLLIDTKTLKVEYITGQEWHSEHAILRDIFDLRR